MSFLKSRVRFNYIEKIATCFIFYILVLFPLMYGPKHYADITEMKFLIFKNSTYIYAGICFVCLITYALIKRTHVYELRKEEFPFSITVTQIAAVCYLIWTFISSFACNFSMKQTKLGFGRFEGWLSVILYTIVFITLSFWGEYKDSLPKLIAGSVIIFSYIGIFQFFKDGIIYPKGYTFWDARFVSTLGNVDMVGGYVAMMIPVLFCTYVLIDEKKWGYLYLVAIALLNFIFLMSDVDSGKVGLLVGLVFAIIFLVDEEEKIKKFLIAFGTLCASAFLRFFFNLSKAGFNINFGKKTLFFFILSALFFTAYYFLDKKGFKLPFGKDLMHKYSLITLGGLIFLVLVFVFFYRGSNQLLKEASELLHFKLSDGAGSGRGYIWKTSLKLAAKSPFFGYGPGSFGEIYKTYDILTTYTDFAHNDFIQIAMCTGFVGVELYLFFCISLLVRAWKYMSDNKYIVIFATACVSYLVHSFFSFSIAIITPPFWVMAGLLDSLIRREKQSRINDNKNI